MRLNEVLKTLLFINHVLTATKPHFNNHLITTIMSVTTTLSIAERTAISQGLTTQDEIELFHLDMIQFQEEICREENMEDIKAMENSKSTAYYYDNDDLMCF